MLSEFYSSILCHALIPNLMSESVITPILKSSLKTPSESSNYRPISASSTGSKILERIVYSGLKRLLSTSEYRFSFKPGLSTLSCIFSLGEVVNYYHCLNSKVLTCFVDMKSAFDRVSFNKLFGKLLNRGAQLYIVLLLMDWYTGQRLYVMWGAHVRSRWVCRMDSSRGQLSAPTCSTFI